MRRSFFDYVTICILFYAFFFFGCATVTTELLVQPIGADLEQGREVSRQVSEQMGVYEEPGITSYITGIGRRLVNKIPERRFDYSIQIVDQAEPNAFAAPGGYVYVSRGLIALANSEDELANVIGHEIIHVEQRHTAKQLAKQRVPGLLRLPGQIVGAVVQEDLGRLINVPVLTVGMTYLANYSRQHELESDRLGQQLSASAGYDPLALATILERLEMEADIHRGEKRRFSFFDSHPTTPRRVREVTEQAGSIEWTRIPGITRNRDTFLEHLDKLLIGENPGKGVFQGQKFLHPGLDLFLEFPEKWKTANTPQAVGAVSASKDALLVLGIHSEGSDPDKVARAFIEALKKEYGIKPSRSESVKVGEWPAYLVTLTDDTGREPMHMHFLWIASRGLIYQMIGIGPERYRETLRNTALSLRPLTAQEKSSIRETRLRIVSAGSGEKLSELSERTRNQWDLQTTAVMNGIAADESLVQGRLIKIAVSEQYKGAVARK